MKSYTKRPCYLQDGATDPAEDQPWPRGTLRHIPESPFGLSGGLREGSLSSQDSRTESASLSQSQVNGFFASHLGDRGWQEAQRGSPSPSVTSKITEKTFSDSNRSRSKARRPGIANVIEHPDCADSDVDDSLYTSSQDHQTPKQAWFHFNPLGRAIVFSFNRAEKWPSPLEGVAYQDAHMVLDKKSSLYLPPLTAAAFDADWQSKALNINPEVATLRLGFISLIFKCMSVENFGI